MATEGSFGGGGSTSNQTTALNDIIIAGFSGMMKGLVGIADEIVDLHATEEKILRAIENQTRASNAKQEAIKQLLQKQIINDAKSSTNSILNSIASTLSIISNNIVAMSIPSQPNTINNPFQNPNTTPQIIKWDEQQYADFMEFMRNIDPMSEGKMDSLREIFEAVSGGIAKIKNKTEKFSFKNFFGYIFAPTFKSKAKTFVKAFEIVVKGIEKAFVKMDKNASKIERSSKALVSAIDAINASMAKNDTGKRLKSLAGGIALLGLSIVAFALISPMVLILTGSLMLMKTTMWAMARSTSKDVLKITVALALLALTIWAFGEIVTSESMIKTVGGIIILGLAIKGFIWAVGGGFGKKGLITLYGTIIAVAALGIALATFNDVEWESMAKGAVAVAGMAGALYLMGQNPMSMASALALVVGGLAVMAIGKGLSYMPSDPMIYAGALLFIAGYATVLGVAGGFAPVIALGAGAMIVAGLALVVIGAGLAIIAGIDWDANNMNQFTTCLADLFTTVGTPDFLGKALIAVGAGIMMTLAMVLITAVAGFTLLVSQLPYDPTGMGVFVSTLNVLFLNIGTASFLATAGMALVASVIMAVAMAFTMSTALDLARMSDMKYNLAGVTDFGLALKAVATVYKNLATDLGLIGTAKFLAGVALAKKIGEVTPSVAMGLAMAGVASQQIENTDMVKFGEGIKQLLDAYLNNAKTREEILKIESTSRLVAGIAGATKHIAEGISAFVAIAGKPEDIERAIDGIALFIDKVIGVLASKSKQLESVPEGAMKILGIGNLMKDVAEGMRAMGNMEYYETKLDSKGNIVRTGKAIKFTDSDYKAVGDSISKLINAVADPLAKIGEDGGWFTSNKTKKGIDALSKIGQIFTPIVEIVKAFKQDKVTINNKDVLDVTLSLSTILLGTSRILKRLSDEGTLELFDKKPDLLNGFKDIFKYLGTLKAEDLGKVGVELNKIMSTIADEKPFSKMEKGLAKVRKEATLIKNEINKLDLQKMTMFNKMTENLLTASKNGSLDQLIKAIADLVQQIKDVNSTPVPQASSLNPSLNPIMTPSVTPTPTQGKQTPVNMLGQNAKTPAEVLEETLKSLMTTLQTEMKTGFNRIQNPMPVKIVNGQTSI